MRVKVVGVLKLPMLLKLKIKKRRKETMSSTARVHIGVFNVSIVNISGWGI